MNEAAAHWMIYGANGYTGKLIAREAARRGMRPVLAGRSEQVEVLARELGFESRRFGLDSPDEAARGLEGMALVLHCAGPFSATSQPMLEACLRAKASYLDITGEIDVFEGVFARDAELRAAGVFAIPGVGFDVVPTDCLALKLKERLPSATRLRLAFEIQGKASPGTLKTSVESLGRLRERRDGKIVEPLRSFETMTVDFGDGRPRNTVQIPWGDVSTAYYSTGIPNIQVFLSAPPSLGRMLRLGAVFGAVPGVKRALKKLVEWSVPGPNEEERRNSRAKVWGRVEDDQGQSVELRIETPDGYDFTVLSALAAVEKLLASGRPTFLGALTPSKAFGSAFVDSLSVRKDRASG